MRLSTASMKNIDWTEIQSIISVAKLGSLSAAARLLSVSHSTILRRIQSFEYKHRIQVFVREQQGYHLSRHGRALLQDFDQIDRFMQGLQRRVTDYDAHLQGQLTLTTTENLFGSFVKKPLLEFAKVFPSIELELMISNQLVNMDQLEADVAVRPMAELPIGYFGFPLFELVFWVYGPSDHSGEVHQQDPFDYPDWVGFSGHLASARVGQILVERLQCKPALRADSFDGVAAAAEAGLGRALLPSFIGDALPGLSRLKSIEPIFTTRVFVLAPDDLKVSRRVNALLNYLNVYFQH